MHYTLHSLNMWRKNQAKIISLIPLTLAQPITKEGKSNNRHYRAAGSLDDFVDSVEMSVAWRTSLRIFSHS